MKKIIIGTFAFALMLSSCKTMQRMKGNEAAAPAQQEQTQTKVFSVAEPQATSPQPAAPQQPATNTYQAPAKPVRTQTETFTFDQKDDAAKYQGSSFFVIIGSFSSLDNANRYKQELIPQGFNPIVLHSETGYYRVCVNSYAEEMAARQRVNQIRTDFPKYADTWLLVKK
ncbi:SPOR domain-containing protein [Mangrovibacterium marinum]|uniref:Sporulation related protein n=1 Tax=Mangrovibacterium marinum TaxID=1639118 RepID=A0A2T5C2Y1_9BACT|nr:SPOR domain-containing protein [Mangrovibacterium marinum]PTN09086.1 sporulation related protein [Mangrovibacterium marinum]